MLQGLNGPRRGALLGAIWTVLLPACAGEVESSRARADAALVDAAILDARDEAHQAPEAAPLEASRPVEASPHETGPAHTDADGRDVAAPGDAADADVARPDAAESSVDAGPLPDRFAIAEGQATPTGIAVNDRHVYFANRDAGTIVRCPIRGCGAAAPAVVVSDQDNPISLALDATHLYWVTGWRPGDRSFPASRHVFRCELPTCATGSIEAFDQGTARPYSLTLVDDTLYLVSWGQSNSCSTTGCTGTEGSLAFGPLVSVDRHDSYLYQALLGWQEVARCVLPGCTEETTLLTGVRAAYVLVDDVHLYVAEDGYLDPYLPPDAGAFRPRLLRCPTAGCDETTLTVLEDEDISPYALAQHGDRLYFTNVSHGSVISRRK